MQRVVCAVAVASAVAADPANVTHKALVVQAHNVTRKALVAEAHTEEKEVDSAWNEVEAAVGKQQEMLQRMEGDAARERQNGNAKKADEMDAQVKKVRGIESELDGQLGNMKQLLQKAKPYIPENLLQRRKNSKSAVGFLQMQVEEEIQRAPEDELAKEMTHDLEMNFNKIAPFGKEDTAKELQDHAAKTQDTLVDAVENAEVAEIKRAVFRALTRLRAATIKEFDTIARLETQAIDAYNDAHHYRAENPLAHLHEDEAPVETDKLKSFH